MTRKLTEEKKFNKYLLESYYKVKKEYNELVESGSDPKLQSILESNLWFVSTGMGDAEINQLPEEEKKWCNSFIETHKDHYKVVEEELRNSEHPPFSLRSEEEQAKVITEGMGSVVQQLFSQRGIVGGLLKQTVEMQKMLSKGICPSCQRTITSDQLKEDQLITCDHCGMSMRGGAGELEKIVDQLEEKGEILNPDEMGERGVFFNKELAENIRKFKEREKRMYP